MTTLEKIKDLTWWNEIIKLKDILLDLFGRIETLEESGSVEEAPIDGTQYARQDGEWAEIVGGGGGSQNLQSVLDNGKNANTDGGNSYIDLLVGTANERTNYLRTGDDTKRSNFISTKDIIQINNTNEDGNTSSFIVQNGELSIVKYKDGLTTSIFTVDPISNSNIYFASPLEGDYIVPISVNGNVADISGNIEISNINTAFTEVADDFANDAAAAIGGIAVGELYHTAGVVKLRLS